MRSFHATYLVISILNLVSGAEPTQAQVSCPAGLSFPNIAIDRNPVIFNTAADLKLAVSPYRILLVSNDKFQLRCRSTGGKLIGTTNTIAIRGADLSLGFFVSDPATDDLANDLARNIFDPRVIYDNYAGRFWIVASENGAAFETYVNGRIHIAVSSSATPNSWTNGQSGSWFKLTNSAIADKAAINVQDYAAMYGNEFINSFPDHCSIAVDRDYLYICYREARQDVYDPAQLASVIVIYLKSDITSTCQMPPCAAPSPVWVSRIDTGLWTHELAVDYAIDPNADPGAYIVSKGPKGANGKYGYIRLGRVYHDNGGWHYAPTDIALPSANEYYKTCGSMRGGNYGGNQIDRNTTFVEFAGAVTRPDHDGARKIWAVHAVGTSFGGCPQNVLQWYKINPANNSVSVERYTPPNGDHAHDPSIGVNAIEDVVIGFNLSPGESNTTDYPAVYRLVKPYGGSAAAPEKAGPSIVYRPRSYGIGDSISDNWADYTGTEPDPMEGCQFWSHQMTVYGTGTGVSDKWQSRLHRIRVGCGGGNLALRGNLDMDEDGELTASDIEIYGELAGEGEPEMDRTEDEVTDISDFLDFLNEWDDPN